MVMPEWVAKCMQMKFLQEPVGIMDKICKVHVLTNMYRKVPKFLDARKLCCNLPKILEKRPNLRVFRQKDANGVANRGDPDQTAPLGAV